MVVDTSILVCIERKEAGADEYEDAIIRAGGAAMSAASFVEFNIVTVGNGSATDAIVRLEALLRILNIQVHEVSVEDAMLARDAFLRYGKGRHPAGLNFGDCFSYALAKRLGKPLLFKGNDFRLTDVVQI